MSVLRYYGCTNSFIRILGSLVCIIVTFYLLSLVLCCDIYRSTLISLMYPACMITVHGRKSRALQRARGMMKIVCLAFVACPCGPKSDAYLGRNWVAMDQETNVGP